MSGHWSENAALFKRLVKIHSNPPILFNNNTTCNMYTCVCMTLFLCLKLQFPN